MINQIANNPISISRKTVRRNGGVVILSLQEYEELRKKAMPAYYLEGKEADKLDKLVKEGLRDYRQGKCKAIKSLAEIK